MKRSILIFSIFTVLFCLLSLLSTAQQDMTRAIQESLKDNLFKSSDVSIAIYDLSAGREVYSYRSEKMCRPASTHKLITTITALALLGEGHTFDTQLRYTGSLTRDSVLHGDLYMVGGFDPLFKESDLDEALSALHKAGIARIEGKVIGDVSFADSLYWGPGWSWDDTPWYFQPYLSPLMLNEGCIDITVSPTLPGEAPAVSCTPRCHFYSVDNRAVSMGADTTQLNIMRDWVAGSNRIAVWGNCKEVTHEKMNMFPSQEFFMSLLLERMDSLRITRGGSGWGEAPATARPLYTCRRSLDEVADSALRESDNLCAESMLYHLAARSGSRHVGQKMGCAVIDSFITAHFERPQSYRIVDGSGLSLYNYYPVSLMMQYLIYAHQNPAIYNALLRHLPQSGISGTLKNRMGEKGQIGKVYAKTGTVSGICTLAGYAQGKSGHTLAFVLFNQNVMKPSLARQWQNKICTLLCNY